jgi:hypothetical protein
VHYYNIYYSIDSTISSTTPPLPLWERVGERGGLRENAYFCVR